MWKKRRTQGTMRNCLLLFVAPAPASSEICTDASKFRNNWQTRRRSILDRDGLQRLLGGQ